VLQHDILQVSIARRTRSCNADAYYTAVSLSCMAAIWFEWLTLAVSTSLLRYKTAHGDATRLLCYAVLYLQTVPSSNDNWDPVTLKREGQPVCLHLTDALALYRVPTFARR